MFDGIKRVVFSLFSCFHMYSGKKKPYVLHFTQSPLILQTFLVSTEARKGCCYCCSFLFCCIFVYFPLFMSVLGLCFADFQSLTANQFKVTYKTLSVLEDTYKLL